MSAQIYAPRMRLPHTPCRQDCGSRSETCHAACCSWALYESIRNHIYDVNHRAREDVEPDAGAERQIRQAGKKDRRGKGYAAK